MLLETRSLGADALDEDFCLGEKLSLLVDEANVHHRLDQAVATNRWGGSSLGGGIRRRRRVP